MNGCWVSPEIDKALQLGYKVLEVNEVYHYEKRSKYSEDGGLFADYINCFLRLKQQVSGWPSHVSCILCVSVLVLISLGENRGR